MGASLSEPQTDETVWGIIHHAGMSTSWVRCATMGSAYPLWCEQARGCTGICFKSNNSPVGWSSAQHCQDLKVTRMETETEAYAGLQNCTWSFLLPSQYFRAASATFSKTGKTPHHAMPSYPYQLLCPLIYANSSGVRAWNSLEELQACAGGLQIFKKWVQDFCSLCNNVVDIYDALS